jgi:hypothetical protein
MPSHVRPVHDDLPVEAPGPQQRGIQHVGTIRGRDDDDALVRLEAVHLDEQLVERLLALIVPATKPRAAMPTDSINLVDKNYAIVCKHSIR